MTAPTVRPVRPDDAERVLAMWHVHQRAVLGRPDSTVDDARDLLGDPDLHPGSPVVVADDGRVLGCALVHPEGGRADLDVVVDPGPGAPFAAELLETAVGLAAAAARENGAAEVEVDQSCYRQDEAFAQVLRAAGFAVATTFHRLRRELTDPVEVTVPEGVVVERADEESDEVLRRVHALHTSTFRGHFGFHARPYDEWLAVHRSRATPTGPHWFARLDGVDVGFLSETDQFVPDEDAGYVQRLGVEDAARGRGVAKALLLSSFAHMRERGRAAALLSVDSANETGATRLYESVGMRPVVVLDVWRRRLPAS